MTGAQDLTRLLAEHRKVLSSIALGAIVVLAALVRLWNIGGWPVFIDEDIYAWGASVLAPRPLSEAIQSDYWGKSPLPLYLQGRLGSVAGDALLSGRLLAAAAGTATTLLCCVLGGRIGGLRVGLAAAILYALSPLAVLHERMALLDGPMAAFSLACVLAAWNAIERRSWPWAGASLVAGVLAVQVKIPAFATALVPLLLLLSYRGSILSRVPFAVVAAAGPVLSYAALMLSPLGKGLSSQNADLMVTPTLAGVQENFGNLSDSILAYMPAGLPLFALAGAFLLWRRLPWLAVVFLAVIASWSLPWLILSRFAPSRYYLPALPFVYALAALALVQLPVRITRAHQAAGGVAAAVCVFIVAASAVATMELVAAPAVATLSKLDDWQYRSGWASGYGYSEAAEYVAQNAAPGSSVAFVIDARHRVGAGLLHPLPAGVTSLGVVTPNDDAALKRRGELYVVVDDRGADDEQHGAGRRVATVMARNPGLRLVATFRRPGNAVAGTYVLHGSN